MGNPSAMRGAKGGLAIGVCGHVPTGDECYSTRFNGAILYSSGNGLVGKDTIGASNVQPAVSFTNDSTFGVKYDPSTRTLTWYQNGLSIGQCAIAAAELDRFQVVYPIFALFDVNQAIEVDFSLKGPHDKSRNQASSTNGSIPGYALADGSPGFP